MTSSLGTPEEIGAVYVSVLPSLAGAVGILTKGGTDGAETYSKAFMTAAKDVIPKGLSDMPGLKDTMTKAGESSSKTFADKFTDVTKSAMKGAGADAADTMSKAFSDKTKTALTGVGTTVATVVSDELTDAMPAGGTKAAASLVDSFTSTLKSANLEGFAGDLGGKVGHLLGGSIGDALKDIPGLGELTDTLQHVGDKATELGDKFQDAHGYIKDAKDILGSLGDDAPRVIGALGGIAAAAEELAGPLAAAAAAAGAIIDLGKSDAVQNNAFGRFLFGDWRGGDKNSFVGPGSILDEIGDMFGADLSGRKHKAAEQTPAPTDHAPSDQPTIGAAGGADTYTPHFGDKGGGGDFGLSEPGEGLGGAGSGAYTPPSNSVRIGPVAPPAGSFYRDWYQPPDDGSIPAPADVAAPRGSRGASGGSSGGSSGGGSTSLPRVSRALGSVGSRGDLHAAGSRIANLYMVAQALQGTPYSQALRDDCSGMTAQLASAALGLPAPPAAQRFTTMNEGDWLADHGFQPGLGGPGDYNVGWNSQHTASTLPGGIHAESGGNAGGFTLGAGAAGAEDSQFTQHAHLPMDGKAGGPLGTQNDPLYIMPSPNAQGGMGGQRDMAQGSQLGQGLSSGLLQGLGFPDVFGKSPTQWGSVQLGMGVLGYGMNFMNRIGQDSAAGRISRLPGGSPGRDNLLGLLPSGKAVGLQGGEGVIRPEAMRMAGVPNIVRGLNHGFAQGGIVGGGKGGTIGGGMGGVSAGIYAGIGALEQIFAQGALDTLHAAHHFDDQPKWVIDEHKKNQQQHQQAMAAMQQRQQQHYKNMDDASSVTAQMRPPKPVSEPAKPTTITHGPTFNINQEGVMSPKDAGATIRQHINASTAHTPSALSPSLTH